MESLFEELKHAREAKRLSLSDIADATLINISYLGQIEQGNTNILPQAYVRAFIREYAATVGLDPDDVMKKYDQSRTPTVPPADSLPPAVPARAESSASSSSLLRWVFVGVGVVGAAIILWASLTRETPPPVKEIPFQSVVTEHEKRFAPPPASQKPADAVPPSTAPVDSLILRGTVIDTVWVQLAIDQNPARDYIFRPNTRMTWKARERFTVTLGNAGAIQFTLNQKQIGAIGKPGNVVRNFQISRETLAPK